MILIFNVNTNHEKIIFRFFNFSKFEIKNVKKIITEIDISIVFFFQSKRIFDVVFDFENVDIDNSKTIDRWSTFERSQKCKFFEIFNTNCFRLCKTLNIRIDLWQSNVYNDVVFWFFDVDFFYYIETKFDKRWIVHSLNQNYWWTKLSTFRR